MNSSDFYVQVAEKTKGILACISQIEQEEDPEFVKIYVERIDELDKSFADIDKGLFPDNEVNTKESIRLGCGNYSRIQQKCIDMGVV